MIISIPNTFLKWFNTFIVMMTCTEKSKITAVLIAFSYGGTITHPLNIVPPKENAVGTAVILDFITVPTIL